MAIDRCICHQRSFEEIKKFAEEHDVKNIEDLQDANVCSTSCQLCVPYVKRMLETGETSFPLDFIINSTQ